MNDNRLNDEYNEGYKAEHRVLNDPKCGIRPSANRRVIDGTDAGFGTFPWQALIRIGKAKVRFCLQLSLGHGWCSQCGGVLINRQHVVTAGHCIKNKKIEDLTVTLGEYNIAESRDYEEFYPSQTYKVRAMVVHPGFKFSPAADR